MICPECYGIGKTYSRKYHLQGMWFFPSCRTCNGTGIINCCEGEVAQVGELLEPPSLSTTAALPIHPHAPTSEAV